MWMNLHLFPKKPIYWPRNESEMKCESLCDYWGREQTCAVIMYLCLHALCLCSEPLSYWWDERKLSTRVLWLWLIQGLAAKATDDYSNLHSPGRVTADATDYDGFAPNMRYDQSIKDFKAYTSLKVLCFMWNTDLYENTGDLFRHLCFWSEIGSLTNGDNLSKEDFNSSGFFDDWTSISGGRNLPAETLSLFHTWWYLSSSL